MRKREKNTPCSTAATRTTLRTWHSAIATSAVACAVSMALVGCGGGTPSVSSTRSEATVHGTVKYKGAPVEGGTISFDPSNIQRRDAKIASAPIGKDGSYTVKTLQGTNMVRFDLPDELRTKDPAVATAEKEYRVPSGDSTFDVDVGQ